MARRFHARSYIRCSAIVGGLLLGWVSSLPGHAFPPAEVDDQPDPIWAIDIDSRGREGTIETAVFSPDSQMVATGSGDGKLRLLQVSDGRVVRQMEYWTDRSDDKQGEVEAIAFSPDGRYVVAGGNAGGIKVYQVSNGRRLRRLGSRQADGIAFSNNGQFFAAPDDRDLMLYRVSNWDRVYRNSRTHTCGINSIDFTPDDQQVLTGACDRTVKISRTQDGRLVRTIQAAMPRGSVKSVRVSPDGNLFATANGSEGSVKVFVVADGSLVATLPQPGVNVEAVAFSIDGDYLAVGGGDLQSDEVSSRTGFRLYRVADFSLVRQVTGHAEGVEYLDFSSDGQYLVSAGEDGILKLWSMASLLTSEAAPPISFAVVGTTTLLGSVFAWGAITRRRFSITMLRSKH